MSRYVLLAAYTLTVSIVFAVISVVAPEVASAGIVFFVALLLVPACTHEVRAARRRRRGR